MNHLHNYKGKRCVKCKLSFLCSPPAPVQCFENKQLYFANRLAEAMKVITTCFLFLAEILLFQGLFFLGTDVRGNLHLLV